jgi:hypothetical protein
VLDVAELSRDAARGGRTPFPGRATGQLRLVDIAGSAALSESAPWVDRVHSETHLSLLAGLRWLEEWSRAFRGWEPWVLTLLDEDEPLTPALQAALEPSRLYEGDPRPVLRLDDGTAERPLSANTRAALAKARNRIRREGHRLEVQWAEDWGQIRPLFAEIVSIHRARDLEFRGMTLLDDPEEADFYEQVFARHAELWRVLSVRIDDALAGYAICLPDGGTLRVWDNRVSPGWRRYSAGLIANAEVVVSAGADPAVREVDWGCGLQRYKTSMSNQVMQSEHIVAWSSAVLRARQGLTHRLHARGWLPGGV